MSWVELVGALIGYVGIGMTVARSLAKTIYRSVRKRFKGQTSQAQAAYEMMMATWVFLWPAKFLFYLVKYGFIYLIGRPIEWTVRSCANLVHAPVAAALNDVQAASDEALAWTQRAGEEGITDIDKEFAVQMRADAYERHEKLCGDLGLPKQNRLAITAARVAARPRPTPASDAITEGMRIASEVLNRQPSPSDRDSWPPVGRGY